MSRRLSEWNDGYRLSAGVITTVQGVIEITPFGKVVIWIIPFPTGVISLIGAGFLANWLSPVNQLTADVDRGAFFLPRSAAFFFAIKKRPDSDRPDEADRTAVSAAPRLLFCQPQCAFCAFEAT